MTMDGKGGLFDVNPVPAGKNEGLVPLKQHGAIADTAKYGGYNKASTAYFLLVRSKGKKGKMMLSLEAYPLWRRLQTAGSKEDKLCFCVEQGLSEPEILMDPHQTEYAVLHRRLIRLAARQNRKPRDLVQCQSAVFG